MKYYAKLWNCGFGTINANTGKNQVVVYVFDSREERDAACAEYRAPTHCPTATLQPVNSSDEDVSRERRADVGILEWDGLAL